MLGKKIRGVNHLWRVTESFAPILIKFANKNDYAVCVAAKINLHSENGGKALVIFNDYYATRDTIRTTDFDDLSSKCKEIKNYSKVLYILENYKNNMEYYNTYFEEIVLLPTTFFGDYENFVKNNLKIFTKLSQKYGFVHSSIIPKLIYIYSEGSRNFFEWAINLFFGQRISFNVLKFIFNWNDKYSQLARNLSKGTITAYTTSSAVDKLLTEMSLLRKNKRICDAINSFNTAQKKLIKNAELTEKQKETLERFSRLSKMKKLNFIKKVSTIEDFNEIMRQMRLVSSVHFDWNKESFIEYLNEVEGLNYKKIWDKDSIVLLQVMDFDTIKQLGKTTNWCISKNKSYWNSYVEHHGNKVYQYILFDFSKREDENLSIVGFTVKHNKGITNAHDFVNNSLMESTNAVNLLNSYISNFLNGKNIYNILEKSGIDLTLISKFDTAPYNWNKKDMLEYLYECVNKENVDVLMESDTKMALSVKDENIRYFFGDTYQENIPSDYWGLEHILFIDFASSKYDSEKLQFAIINSNYEEDYCISIFNEHSLSKSVTFETKLIEYSLPYDIIRRSSNAKLQLRDAIMTFNTPMFKESVKSFGKNKRNNILQIIHEDIGSENFHNILRRTVIDFMSFDYIDILYENGISISDAIGHKYLSDFLAFLCSTIWTYGRFVESNFGLPKKEEIDSFLRKEIGVREYAIYLGCYILFEKILKQETKGRTTCNVMLQGVVQTISMKAFKGEIFDRIMLEIGEKVNLNDKNIAKFFINYASIAGKELLDFLAKHDCIDNNQEIEKSSRFYNYYGSLNIDTPF